MAGPPSLQRLKKELQLVEREPPPHVTARPLPSCLLKWYFVIEGPAETPYANGLYMGKLVFPEEYPYKPPYFHPETWNPVWSVSAVLTGLLSFMLGNEETVGSIKTSDSEKKKLAKMCHDFNQRDKIFRALFPDFIRLPEAIESTASVSDNDKPTDLQNNERDTRKKSEPHQESIVSLLGWITLLLALCVGAYKIFAQLGASSSTS